MKNFWSNKIFQFLKNLILLHIVFLVLNLTKEGIDKRLLARHGNDDQAGIDAANMMRNVFAGFEPAGADEKNTYNVDIDADMSIEDVMNKILKILEKL